MATSLEGKVALVTGTSRGIGAAIARALDAEGVKLGLASRSGEDLGIADAVAQRCDVTDYDQLKSIVDATVERFGRLDILIPNAGVGTVEADLGELSVADIDRMLDTNAKGTIYAAHAALGHLLESDAADIVSVASVAGLRGFPQESVYCASKHGQVGFLRSLDHELHERGVRCTNVCPGGVATDFAIRDGHGRSEGAPELDEMMSGEDVAEAVLFVLTRPRDHRILTMSLRPAGEPSWG